MKRILTASLLLVSLAASGQEPTEREKRMLVEIQKLQIQNMMLKRQVDSLQSALNYKKISFGVEVSSLDGDEVIDTWDLLIGGDGYVEDILTRDESLMGKKREERRKGIYEQRLEALDPVLMIPYDERLGQYIESYTVARHKRMSAIAARYERYEDYFREVFEKHGVPGDVTALCIVESAVNPQAISHAGAAGMWQIMPDTAVEHGLNVGMLGDERYDVAKSTDVAARVLAGLHRFFGDWPLAICAYNCGPGNVSTAIRKAGGRRGFWDIYDYLPRETRAYLPSFIASLYFINYNGL